MNLSDLTEELHHRAGEAGSPRAGDSAGMGALEGSSPVGRVGAVRRRIQVRRRRRLAAAGAVVVCAVAAAFVAPSVDLGRERTLPVGVDTTSPFPAHDGGDPLLASVWGQPGETDVRLQFTPSDLDLSVTAVCSDTAWPDEAKTESPARSYEVVMPKGGQRMGGTCRAYPELSTWFTFGDRSAENVQGWKDMGLTAGGVATLHVRLADAPGITRATGKVRLGIAVYQRSGTRVTDENVRLRELITFGGRDYRLVEHHFGNLAGAGEVVTLDVPAAQATTPFVIVAGATAGSDVPATDGQFELRIDGQVDESEGWGLSTQALEDTAAHRLTLKVTGTAKGTAVIAYYAPVE